MCIEYIRDGDMEWEEESTSNWSEIYVWGRRMESKSYFQDMMLLFIIILRDHLQ